MRICLLDVGRTMYGDCILVTQGNRKILIDGAHPSDANRIRSQLKKLLDQDPPFEVDLLVVTHCHSDHIGCLPALVTGGDLLVKYALVADEKLGWGLDARGRGPADAKNLSDRQRLLLAALQEEDHSHLPQAELGKFFEDAASLAEKYGKMLDHIGQQGGTVVRYGRDPSPKVGEIEAAFADFGLKVLGPTTDQLVVCAETIAQASDAIADAVGGDETLADADVAQLGQAYCQLLRQFGSDAAFAADRPGVGAAKNDQSIVLKVEADSWGALLAGDMQFAKPEVPGLNPMMTALRQQVVDAGPYDFIKLTHHTSYNGLDRGVLQQWSATRLFGHTGGSNDPNHPDEGALQLLESKRDQLTFARTDHNGAVIVEKNGKVTLEVDKGRLNDFTVNEAHDEPGPAAPPPARPVEGRAPAAPWVEPRGNGDVVEVFARVPHTTTKVTLTLQVEPGEAGEKKKPTPPRPGDKGARRGDEPVGPSPGITLGGKRKKELPRLLFVTCRPRLELNIGRMEASRVFEGLGKKEKVRLVDLPPGLATAQQAAALVRPQLASGDVAGVVILGGFDVVPAHRLDVLDAAARQGVVAAGQDGQDADDFVVWSDELYGDRDGDFLPDLPVSRIPDGRRSDVVFAALQSAPQPLTRKFGVRNLARPFAGAIYQALPGVGGALEVSERCSPETIPPGAAAGAVYFMLHGSARDGTRFWGETQGGAAVEAVAIENVPTTAPGAVVFTGCCWGALTSSPPAARARPETLLRPRGPEASLAVAYLRAGAIGFVGCTGSHYSPALAPYDYFGKPMHEAFWTFINQDKQPAEALFLAKKEFVRKMPHGRTDPFSRAVEFKILRQYTCLGLGW